MSVDVTVHDPLRGDPHGWDDFVRRERLPSGWYCAPLRAYAAAPPWRVLLLQVDVDGATAAQLVVVRGLPLRPRTRYAPRRWQPPTVWSCRLPVSANKGYAFAGGTGPAERRVALRAAGRALGHRALATVYLYVGEADLALFDGWILRRRTSDAGVFEVRWASHDAYLASLPSRRRRRVVRLVEQAESDATLVPFEAPRIDAVAAVRLDLLTRGRQLDRRTIPLPVGYFEALGEVPGTRFFGYREAGGSLRAFDLLLGGGREVLGTVTGSDADASQGGLALSLYDREIRYGIASQATSIDFGPGQLDLKRRLGCVAHPRWLVGLPPRRRV